MFMPTVISKSYSCLLSEAAPELPPSRVGQLRAAGQDCDVEPVLCVPAVCDGLVIPARLRIREPVRAESDLVEGKDWTGRGGDSPERTGGRADHE